MVLPNDYHCSSNGSSNGSSSNAISSIENVSNNSYKKKKEVVVFVDQQYLYNDKDNSNYEKTAAGAADTIMNKNQNLNYQKKNQLSGHQHPDQHQIRQPKQRKRRSTTSNSSAAATSTILQLLQELDNRGIRYSPKSTRKELEELLVLSSSSSSFSSSSLSFDGQNNNNNNNYHNDAYSNQKEKKQDDATTTLPIIRRDDVVVTEQRLITPSLNNNSNKNNNKDSNKSNDNDDDDTSATISAAIIDDDDDDTDEEEETNDYNNSSNVSYLSNNNYNTNDNINTMQQDLDSNINYKYNNNNNNNNVILDKEQRERQSRRRQRRQELQQSYYQNEYSDWKILTAPIKSVWNKATNVVLSTLNNIIIDNDDDEAIHIDNNNNDMDFSNNNNNSINHSKKKRKYDYYDTIKKSVKASSDKAVRKVRRISRQASDILFRRVDPITGIRSVRYEYVNKNNNHNDRNEITSKKLKRRRVINDDNDSEENNIATTSLSSFSSSGTRTDQTPEERDVEAKQTQQVQNHQQHVMSDNDPPKEEIVKDDEGKKLSSRRTVVVDVPVEVIINDDDENDRVRRIYNVNRKKIYKIYNNNNRGKANSRSREKRRQDPVSRIVRDHDNEEILYDPYSNNYNDNFYYSYPKKLSMDDEDYYKYSYDPFIPNNQLRRPQQQPRPQRRPRSQNIYNKRASNNAFQNQQPNEFFYYDYDYPPQTSSSKRRRNPRQHAQKRQEQSSTHQPPQIPPSPPASSLVPNINDISKMLPPSSPNNDEANSSRSRPSYFTNSDADKADAPHTDRKTTEHSFKQKQTRTTSKPSSYATASTNAGTTNRTNKRKIYSPYNNHINQNQNNLLGVDDGKDVLDKMGDLFINSADKILWKIYGDTDSSSFSATTSSAKTATSREQQQDQHQQRRSSPASHWKDHVEQRLDKMLGIHQNSDSYTRWTTKKKQQEEGSNSSNNIGLNGFAVARGQRPSRRKDKKKPIWEEEGNLISLLFGRTASGSSLFFEKILDQTTNQQNGVLTTLVQASFKTIIMLFSYLCRWASTQGAIPQPIVVLCVASAGICSDTKRIRAMILTLLLLRTASEVVHGYTHGSMGWEEEDFSDDDEKDEKSRNNNQTNHNPEKKQINKESLEDVYDESNYF